MAEELDVTSEKSEETENWARLKRIITRDNAVDNERIARLEADANGKWMSDNESRAQKRYDRWMSAELIKQVEKRKKILQEPYFRRIDLSDNNGYTFTCYVSDMHSYIGHDASKLIFDWRDDFVNAFIAGQQTLYQINEFTYTLALRRRISFSAGEVDEVVTDYDAEGLTVDGVIVDNFLMNLLRDKRSNPVLSTIITTIHENQNRIVRAPIEESFAVQGCAGSGKTMVLLHRLSYLIYNHKELNLSHVKIISPTDTFTGFIDDLCKTLELERIERVTPEKYYAGLIKNIQERSAKITGRWYKGFKPLVKADLRGLKSEKHFNINLLKRLYSTELFHELCNEFSGLTVNTDADLTPEEAIKYFNRKIESVYNDFGADYDPDSNYRHMLYLKLLFCALYFGPDENYVSYINIDEAQDFSPAEFLTIKLANGSSTVFNLYGDSNQAVYDYRKTEDLSDLEGIVSKNYYLRENYRNTVQITDLCKNELGIDTVSIGFDGEKVVRDTFEKSIRNIRTMHEYNPELRLAVICSSESERIRKEIEQLLDGGTVLNKIVPGKISIMTAESSKGLEFDGVVVIDSGMTSNEKYISYTRALDNLLLAE